MSGSDDSPRRDGIAEILRSGRFPGVVVTGNRKLTVPISALEEGTHDLKKRQQINERHIAERQAAIRREKERTRLSRKRDGAIRYVGSVPMDEARAIQKQFGREFQGSNRKKILKDMGYIED